MSGTSGPVPSRAGWYWPWLVVLALLGTVGLNVVMMFAATGDANGSVVEPDYYRKAVAWDEAMDRRRESLALGWRVGGALEQPDGSGSARLVLRVEGRDSLPVQGVRFTAMLIHNLDAAHPVSASLVETAPGRYEARIEARRAGLWEVRVDGRRDAQRYSEALRVEAFSVAP